MEETKNRFLSAVYQLYSVKDGERTLEEQTSPDRPFEFITGFGIALDALEQKLMKLEKGSTFDFVLQPEEAFGAYEPAGMHKLERDIFMINGKSAAVISRSTYSCKAKVTFTVCCAGNSVTVASSIMMDSNSLLIVFGFKLMILLVC